MERFDKIFEFEGRGESGDTFCDGFFMVAEDFLDLDDEHESRLLRILLEMIRNIYDHNHGWGYLKLARIPCGGVHFQVGNSSVSQEDRCDVSPGKKSWGNGGAGLGRDGEPGMIVAYSGSILMELEMDIESGYVYKGVLRGKN